MKDLNSKLLNKFDNLYKQEKSNKILENAIKNVGINKVCLNNEVVNKTRNIFSVELPKSKIYNQEESERCWIHAGINLIKNNVAKNLNIEESEYALSVNYLAFLDKLEKSNTIYNRIIENDDFNYEEEIKKDYLKFGVYEGGYFEYFRSLVNKYGIVPELVMPDVKCSKVSRDLTRILSDKVKKDVFKLIKFKKEKWNNFDEIKEEMLKENYNLLAKCLGELPFTFDYEYKDKDGECRKITNITPKEFANKYLTIELNNLIGVANVPMYNKEYNRLYRKNYTENVYANSYVEFMNMPIEVLKDLAIRHLKDGIPVYFGCDMKKMRENDLGVMDSELYNYKDTFNIELLSKEEALSMYDIDFQHVMLITGVHIENEKVIRWKIEDSYGDKVHKDGYYIMNDNFFEAFVIEVIIDKKYLSKEQLEILNQEPILFDVTEPF